MNFWNSVQQDLLLQNIIWLKDFFQIKLLAVVAVAFSCFHLRPPASPPPAFVLNCMHANGFIDCFGGVQKELPEKMLCIKSQGGN